MREQTPPIRCEPQEIKQTTTNKALLGLSPLSPTAAEGSSTQAFHKARLRVG